MGAAHTSRLYVIAPGSVIGAKNLCRRVCLAAQFAGVLCFMGDLSKFNLRGVCPTEISAFECTFSQHLTLRRLLSSLPRGAPPLTSKIVIASCCYTKHPNQTALITYKKTNDMVHATAFGPDCLWMYPSIRVLVLNPLETFI